MLNQLKSYLFGAVDEATSQDDVVVACATNNGSEDEWVLVDTQEVIGDVESDDETDRWKTVLELINGAEWPEEVAAWVKQQEEEKDMLKPSSGRNNGYGRRNRQPKGTKPRRWNGHKSNGQVGVKRVQALMEDNESTSSSIAIVPSPEPIARPAASPLAASTILAASSDAKQMAAITSARIAKQKTEKNWMSRKNLLRGNQTMMVAAGRNNRRSQLIGSRLCGSNNNRKSHQY